MNFQSKVSEENCFTVEFDEKREPLVVVAMQKRIAQCWVRGLSLLVANKGKSFVSVILLFSTMYETTFFRSINRSFSFFNNFVLVNSIQISIISF